MASDKNSDSKAAGAGIPKAVFVDNVEEFMKLSENSNLENVFRRIEEQHQKYKFMEYNLATKKTRLKSQIPDLKTSLDIVKHMQSKKDSPKAIQTHFLLSDQLYAKASVPPSTKVCLWLGANVMLEYNLEDAEQLLQKNLSAAYKSLAQVEDDLGFIRDQTTTIEVNKARVYNWNVKNRQAQKGVAASS